MSKPGWGAQLAGRPGYHTMYSPPGSQAPSNLINKDMMSGTMYDRGLAAPMHTPTMSLVPHTMAGMGKVGGGDDGPVGYGQTATSTPTPDDGEIDPNAILSSVDNPDQSDASATPAATPGTTVAQNANTPASAPGWDANLYSPSPWQTVQGHRVVYALDQNGQPVGIMYVDTQPYGMDQASQTTAQQTVSSKTQTPTTARQDQTPISKQTVPNKPALGQIGGQRATYSDGTIIFTPLTGGPYVEKLGPNPPDAAKGLPQKGQGQSQSSQPQSQGPPASSYSPVLSAINQVTQDPHVQLAMGVGAALEGGLGSSYGAGDGGGSTGPFQINHNQGMHQDISTADTNDPTKAAQYMLKSYQDAVAQIPPDMWTTDPQGAAARAAFLAEKPAQMYPSSRVADAYGQVTGSAPTPSGGGSSSDGSGVPPAVGGSTAGGFYDANGNYHADPRHYGSDAKGEYVYDASTGSKTYISTAPITTATLRPGDEFGTVDPNTGAYKKTASRPSNLSEYAAPGQEYAFNPENGQSTATGPQSPYQIGDQLFVPDAMKGQFDPSQLPANLQAGQKQIASQIAGFGSPGTAIGDDDDVSQLPVISANDPRNQVLQTPSGGWPNQLPIVSADDPRILSAFPGVDPSQPGGSWPSQLPIISGDDPRAQTWQRMGSGDDNPFYAGWGDDAPDPSQMDTQDVVDMAGTPAPPVPPQAIEGMGSKPGETGLLGSPHQGIDVQAQKGTPVIAPESGTIHIEHHETGGLVVYVIGNDGKRYKMAHLDAAHVQEGQKVKKGQPIATVGESGSATTGPNLHFEMQGPQGQQMDPHAALGKMADMPPSPNSVGMGADFGQAQPSMPTPGAGWGAQMPGQPKPMNMGIARPGWRAGMTGVGADDYMQGGVPSQGQISSASNPYPDTPQYNPTAVTGSTASVLGSGYTPGSPGTPSQNYAVNTSPPNGGNSLGFSGALSQYQQLQATQAQQNEQALIAQQQAQQGIDVGGMMGYYQGKPTLQTGEALGFINGQPTTTEQQMYQNQLQSALSNPWVQNLTGMMPGIGLPGGAAAFGATPKGVNPIVSLATGAQTGQVPGATGGGDDYADYRPVGPQRKPGWVGRGDAATDLAAQYATPASAANTAPTAATANGTTSTYQPTPAGSQPYTSAGTTGANANSGGAGAGGAAPLGFDSSVNQAFGGPNTASNVNSGSLSGTSAAADPSQAQQYSLSATGDPYAGTGNGSFNQYTLGPGAAGYATPQGAALGPGDQRVLDWVSANPGQDLKAVQAYVAQNGFVPGGSPLDPLATGTPTRGGSPGIMGAVNNLGLSTALAKPGAVDWQTWQNWTPFQQAAWLTKQQTAGWSQGQALAGEQQALAAGGMTQQPNITQMQFASQTPLQQQALSNTSQIFGQTGSQYLQGQQQQWNQGQAGVGAPVAAGWS